MAIDREFKDAVPGDVQASVASGAAQDVRDAATISAYLSGTFVATVQWQISADGTNWVDSGAAQTAPGVVVITTPAFFVRADTTAFTSGTPVGILVTQST